MYTGVDNTDAYQAIQEQVQTNKHNGYAVISPGSTLGTGSYAVSVNTGTLDASDTLSVGAANDEVLFNGGVQSLSGSTNIGIDSVSESNGNEQYRYDTVWADSSGEVQITQGTAVEVADVESQNNLTRFERFKGTIPFPSTYPSVVIAVVIVSSDDTSVTTDNLRDYRIPADTTANEVDSQSVVTENLSISSWAWVDMVAAGADPTGGDDISSIIESEAADNTLLIFQPGTYRIDSKITLDNLDSFGFLGVGQVEFLIDTAFTDSEPIVLEIGSSGSVAGTNILFKNIDFDISGQSDTGKAGQLLQIFSDDGLLVEDVTVNGTRQDDTDTATVRPEITDSDGYGEVRNVRLPDGGGTSSTGLLQGGSHTGRLSISGCLVEGFEDNGLRCSDIADDATVIYENCVSRNNDVSCLRLGGRSEARNCRVVVDAANANSNPISARDGRIRFEKCSVDVSADTSQVVLVSADCVTATFADCDINVSADNDMLLVDQTATQEQVLFTDCTFTGTNIDTQPPMRVQRPETHFTDCEIDISSGSVTSEALRFEAPDCEVRGGAIECGRWPVHTRDINEIGDRVRIIRSNLNATTDEDIRINGPDDVVVRSGSYDYSLRTDGSPERIYWNGLIAGGPVGGTDIGSLTGANEGDRARSDGTNVDADADELFILKSNGDWQSIADPTITISPA